MKVVVIEDEAPAARRICNLLKESGEEIEILCVIDSVAQGIEWFKNNENADLIFSDIQLSDDLSFSIYAELKLKIPIVFTTAFDEYAIKSFEYHSIDYLQKPVKPEQLKRSLEKYKNLQKPTNSTFDFSVLLEQIKTKNYRSRFLVFQKDSLLPIETKEIAFFYSEEGATFLHTLKGEKFIIDESLEQLEKELNPVYFFRANRQYIVSVNSVKRVHPFFNQKLKVDIVNAENKEIIISKLKATEFKNWLNN